MFRSSDPLRSIFFSRSCDEGFVDVGPGMLLDVIESKDIEELKIAMDWNRETLADMALAVHLEDHWLSNG